MFWIELLASVNEFVQTLDGLLHQAPIFAEFNNNMISFHALLKFSSLRLLLFATLIKPLLKFSSNVNDCIFIYLITMKR